MAARERRNRALEQLESFRRRVPHVSASALSAVLTEAKRQGIPELTSRADVQEARDVTMQQKTPYGELYKSVDLDHVKAGKPKVRLNYVNPFALLSVLLATCVGFSSFFEQVLLEKPSTAEQPWSLVLYSDEVTPGNQLAIANDRKTQVVYWSFLEFGSALSDENLWFTISAKRSSQVHDILGGMANLLGALLKVLFVYEAFELTGIRFKLASGRSVRLFAKLACFVQDGGAHKITWHCKGDSGHRFCMLCRNVVSMGSELADVDTDGNVFCNIIKIDDLDFATDDDLIGSVQRLHACRLTDGADDFEDQQIACGFTYMGYSLMTDPELDGVVRPAPQFLHDWMHCIFASGIWNIVLQFTFKALQDARRPDVYPLVNTLLQHWHWPVRMRQTKLHEMFTMARRGTNNEAKRFKCQASEGLSLYAVLAVILGCFTECPHEFMVYLLLCDLIDCFVAVSRGGSVDPSLLKDRVHAFLQAFCSVYGYEFMTPKFHWLLHFPKHLEEFKMLIACFVHERKHKMVKRYANDVLNTTVFEFSVLSEVLRNPFLRNPFSLTLWLWSAQTRSAQFGFVRSWLAQPSSAMFGPSSLQLF